MTMTNISKLTNTAEAEKALEVTDFVLDRLPALKRAAFIEKMKRDESLALAVSREVELADSLLQVDHHFMVSDKAFDKFSRQLDRQEKRSTSFIELDKNLKRKNSFGYRFAGSLAASFLLLFSIIFFPKISQIFSNNGVDETGFKTLSNGNQQLIDNADGRFYSIVFSPELEPYDRLKVADKYGFEIVSGPGEGQVYTVVVNQLLSGVEQGLLRDTSEILFIEPAVMK